MPTLALYLHVKDMPPHHRKNILRRKNSRSRQRYIFLLPSHLILIPLHAPSSLHPGHLTPIPLTVHFSCLPISFLSLSCLLLLPPHLTHIPLRIPSSRHQHLSPIPLHIPSLSCRLISLPSPCIPLPLAVPPHSHPLTWCHPLTIPSHPHLLSCLLLLLPYTISHPSLLQM